MNRNYLLVCLFASFLYPRLLTAQKVDSMMNIYSEHFPQEKAYVQFDKNVYNPGDIIWFKAYLFNGFDPSTISKNFYAELLDASGTLLQRVTAPVIESSALGSFQLPANFPGSGMHVRGYTTWMLNFDTTLLFERNIQVNGSGGDSSAKKAAADPVLQFFPEGGDLVAGVESSIAFKVNDIYGLPVHMKGVVKDAAGKNLLELNAVHDGMGKFLLTADKTAAYYALWKDDNGKEYRTDLPPVKSTGIGLRVSNNRNKILFSVARPSDAVQFEKVILIGHMNQQMVYRASVNMKDNFMSGGAIPTDQLPSGVLTITVFDLNYMPLAERVVFVNNNNYRLNAGISLSAKSIGKRGRNVIEIQVPDSLKCNLSLAVTDADADGKKNTDDNIISHMLVTGDLKGYVYDPYYYFFNTADSTVQYLDLVMLTHGWRRFKWELLTLGKTPVIKYPLQNYLSLNAEVFGVDTKRISNDENINVILQKKDSSSQMLNIPKIKDGKFKLGGLVFYDTAKAFYQFSVTRNIASQGAIVFNTGLYNGYRKIRPYLLSLPPWTAQDSALLRKNALVMQEARNNFSASQKVKTLESVTITARVRSPLEKLDDEYTSGMFKGNDAYLFNVGDDRLSGGYMDIFSYLQGKVAGLQIVTGGGNTSMQWRGGTPELYLNEVKIDVGGLQAVQVADVALIKVYRPGTIIGAGGGGGTIAVYTKKGAAPAEDPTLKGLDQARVIGYSAIRQFYSPDYLKGQESDAVDIRTTLYWNPLILTDKASAKMTFTFYNSDITKRIRIILEGFSEDGKLTSIEKILE